MVIGPVRRGQHSRGLGRTDGGAGNHGLSAQPRCRHRTGGADLQAYALTEAMDEGHCGLPTEELVPLAEKLLEVPQQLIRTALDLELQEGTVIADRVGETPCVFLAGL